MTTRLCLWLLAALALAQTGCRTVGYYAQAIHGQCQVLRRSQPIQEILADTNTSPVLRSKLQLVLKLRAFAAGELKLPANGHYLDYADLQRPFVVWNVSAAPEFSLKARQWWYPVVGRLDYRGYFQEDRARRCAAELRHQGLDVYVGGVAAYSTLGWFHDPVLNTFLFQNVADVAELLFHELARQRVYVPGDTEFNEAFATAVAEEGLRRWMSAARDVTAQERFRAAAARNGQFVEIVTKARARLESLYAGHDSEPPASDLAKLRESKQRIFEELRQDYTRIKMQWGGREEYDQWFAQPLNNAQINSVDTYYKLVPGFHRLLSRHGGDLEAFYQAVKTIGKLPKEERRRRL